MDSEDYKLAIVITVSCLLLGLGVIGCNMNSAYQFRVGNYCNRINTSDSWVKCEVLKDVIMK